MNRNREPHDDAALRALYRQAQRSITPATASRLHRARHAASQTVAPRRRGWAVPLAAGFAALFALAIGARLWMPDADVSAPAATPILAAADDAARIDDGMEDTLASLEESPDFYRWLAANENTLLALE